MSNRNAFRWHCFLSVAVLLSVSSFATAKQPSEEEVRQIAEASPEKAAIRAAETAKIPVIFDTDIGDDIDDTWALVMLLRSPQFDVKLITTDCHSNEARGRLIAKLLTIAGRDDIPIGLGPGGGGTRQDAWTGDFKLEDYKGKVHKDGVGAIVDTVNSSGQPITVIAVGPLQTLSAALVKEPSIAAKASFVGMHGSVRRGYNGRPKPSAEYNVRRDAGAAARVLSAPWRSIAITPLDTCGIVHLEGKRFETLKQSDDPLVKALLENYRIWAKKRRVAELDRSSTLFDTVAIYLAQPGKKELVKFEELPISVTKSGHTRIDRAGRKMSVATEWKDLDGFRELLLERLISPVTGR